MNERWILYGKAVAHVFLALMCGLWIRDASAHWFGQKYTVDTFPTDDLTIRIQCSGDCDLAAMIAEAREAVEK